MIGVVSLQLNNWGQPVGDSLSDWTPRSAPQRVRIQGRYAIVEPLVVSDHVNSLWEKFESAPDELWTYLSVGPFSDKRNYEEYLSQASVTADPLHFAICDAESGKALGTFALMRQDAVHGVVEMGWVTYSPQLQGTRIATEAQFLMMTYVFDELGYRRYEWKCDSLNEPSRKAAQRLGFTYEGCFRNATVYKQRSRDTDWFSIIDSDWPDIRQAFNRWLQPENFDEKGQQIHSLSELK